MRRGAVFPLVTSMGAAAASDWPGVGRATLVSSYEEDLRAVAAAGVTDVRLPFDWARFEPRDGALDRDALEWYGRALDVAAAAGLSVWACLWEGPVPAWFADDGGFGDERLTGRRWPRFVDRVAAAFGDRLAGWVPFDCPVQRAEFAEPDPQRHADVLRTLVVAWRDTWRLLRGGPPVATWLGLEHVPPVDESPDARTRATQREQHRFELWARALRDGVFDVPELAEREVEDLVGSADALGVVVRFDASVRVDDPDVAEANVERWVQQTGELVRRFVTDAPERPVFVTLALQRDDPDGREAGVAGLVRVAREATTDGIDVTAAFVEPALDGLLSPDREDTDASRALAALP